MHLRAPFQSLEYWSSILRTGNPWRGLGAPVLVTWQLRSPVLLRAPVLVGMHAVAPWLYVGISLMVALELWTSSLKLGAPILRNLNVRGPCLNLGSPILLVLHVRGP